MNRLISIFLSSNCHPFGAAARSNGMRRPSSHRRLDRHLAVLGPLLLPWLPGRAFSVKGAVLGLLFAAGLAVAGAPGPADSWLGPVPWALIVPALSSFVVMLFTGATTFTSLSGVLREMRFAVPLQIAGVVAGFGLWVAGRFVGGGIPG